MKKGEISNFLRNWRLLYLADSFRYLFEKHKNRKNNRLFVKKNPDVALPPDYLIYESFRMNYEKYYTDGADTARILASRFRKFTDLEDKRILDWGCGPGRVIRHLPVYAGKGCSFYGTDYNQQSVGWCKNNLPGIAFNDNTLDATLPYEDQFFDIIYGISVLTHLSEKMHYQWYNELIRILRPGGIMLVTTQGDNFREKLTESEMNEYDRGVLVVRGKVKEGHRTYSAFHPVAFMKGIFRDVDILEHLVTPPVSNKWLPQDTWIIRKPNPQGYLEPKGR